MDTSAASGVSAPSAGPAGPVAALNSVQQVAQRAEYTFDPERYSEASNDNGSYSAVTLIIPIQIQRLMKTYEENPSNGLCKSTS